MLRRVGVEARSVRSHQRRVQHRKRRHLPYSEKWGHGCSDLLFWWCGGVNPIEVVRYTGGNSRLAGTGTADAPRDDAGQNPATVLVNHHRTAAVALFFSGQPTNGFFFFNTKIIKLQQRTILPQMQFSEPNKKFITATSCWRGKFLPRKKAQQCRSLGHFPRKFSYSVS